VAVSGTAEAHESRLAQKPRQRGPLHRLVRRPGAWHHSSHPPGTPRRRLDVRARDARARSAVIGTRGHGNRGHATPLRGARAARESRAPNGPGTPGRHPRGHDGRRFNGPSSQRATTSWARHAVNPPGTPRASVRPGHRPSAALPHSLRGSRRSRPRSPPPAASSSGRSSPQTAARAPGPQSRPGRE